MGRYLATNFLDVPSSSFLSAESERKSERERQCYDYSGKESLDECHCDAELNERGKESEYPNSPFGNGSEEIRRANSSCSCRSRYDPRQCVSDDDRNEEDENSYDN